MAHVSLKAILLPKLHTNGSLVVGSKILIYIGCRYLEDVLINITVVMIYHVGDKDKNKSFP